MRALQKIIVQDNFVEEGNEDLDREVKINMNKDEIK